MRLTAAVMGCAAFNAFTTGPAQAACAVPPVVDSGITIRVSSVKYSRNPALPALVVQFVASNGTDMSISVKSAQWGEGAQPSSGTGVQYFTAVARGISTTQGATGPVCLGNLGCAEKSASFTVIPPRGTMRFSYNFGSMMPPKPSDDITFPVVLIARIGAASPQSLRFQFNSVPAACS